jgi:transposase-like protein
LAAWQTASLDAMDLVGLLIDGVHIGEPCLIVALGIAADGQKHALGIVSSGSSPQKGIAMWRSHHSSRR